jgi:hypothetical protein
LGIYDLICRPPGDYRSQAVRRSRTLSALGIGLLLFAAVTFFSRGWL